METHATVKGQIVIPVELRRKYGIIAGTKIHIYEENGRIILQPVTREFIASVRGSLKGSGALQFLEEERRLDREREDAKFNKRVR